MGTPTVTPFSLQKSPSFLREAVQVTLDLSDFHRSSQHSCTSSEVPTDMGIFVFGLHQMTPSALSLHCSPEYLPDGSLDDR